MANQARHPESIAPAGRRGSSPDRTAQHLKDETGGSGQPIRRSMIRGPSRDPKRRVTRRGKVLKGGPCAIPKGRNDPDRSAAGIIDREHFQTAAFRPRGGRSPPCKAVAGGRGRGAGRRVPAQDGGRWLCNAAVTSGPPRQRLCPACVDSLWLDYTHKGPGGRGRSGRGKGLAGSKGPSKGRSGATSRCLGAARAPSPARHRRGGAAALLAGLQIGIGAGEGPRHQRRANLSEASPTQGRPRDRYERAPAHGRDNLVFFEGPRSRGLGRRASWSRACKEGATGVGIRGPTTRHAGIRAVTHLDRQPRRHRTRARR